MVPVEQILAGDGGNRGVFGLAGVGIVLAVGQLGRLRAPAISPTSSLRREMASSVSFLARSSLSARNSGSRSRSAKTLNTSSKSPFRQDHEIVVESALPSVSTLAARASRKSSSWSPVCVLGAAGAPDFAVHVEHARLCSRARSGSRRECARCRRSGAVHGLPAGKSPCRWAARRAWVPADEKRAAAGILICFQSVA